MLEYNNNIYIPLTEYEDYNISILWYGYGITDNPIFIIFSMEKLVAGYDMDTYSVTLMFVMDVIGPCQILEPNAHEDCSNAFPWNHQIWLAVEYDFVSLNDPTKDRNCLLVSYEKWKYIVFVFYTKESKRTISWLSSTSLL